MNIYWIKKQLRRRWKRWRRAIWTFGACGLVGLMIWLGVPLSEQMKELMTTQPSVIETLGKIYEIDELTLGQVEGPSKDLSHSWIDDIKRSEQVRIVHLNKKYTCGEEESSVLGIMSPIEIENLMKKHPDWTGRVGAGGDVWLEEYIEGLSEGCQEDGYIGVDKNGNLSLFEGPPDEEKVIKTFFQLDVGTMESALPEEVLKQLKQGIRVQDVSEYNSVLSTFSDFALEQNQPQKGNGAK
ncbi:hypothetical protein D3C76_1061590 [compost metagenome]